MSDHNLSELLLCTDLDRTLLPNGAEEESPEARPLFRQFVDREEVILAYVTGRHLELVENAIDEYDLPEPAYAITDVGTKIYTRTGGEWLVFPEWEAEIDQDWAGHDHYLISQLFADLHVLTLQEPDRQNTHKLSYFLPLDVDRDPLLREMQSRMALHGIRSSLIWSIDEPAGVGLLDVLPERSTKLHAIEFLRSFLGVSYHQTVFAGDSGNDLEVMASAVPSVLVGNASDEVRASAWAMAAEAGNTDALYLAQGEFMGMNGNYSAGILEGVFHFLPELSGWLKP